jgi:hypothetical protein
VGSCEHGNELSSFINGGKFLDQLSNYYLPKKDMRFQVLTAVSMKKTAF